MRQEELNEMTLEKENLLLEMEALRTQVRILDEGNSNLRKAEF